MSAGVALRAAVRGDENGDYGRDGEGRGVEGGVTVATDTTDRRFVHNFSLRPDAGQGTEWSYYADEQAILLTANGHYQAFPPNLCVVVEARVCEDGHANREME